MCVPVSIMGRTVGVVHATSEPADRPVDDEAIQSLQALANQAGHRLGMLRIMAETQLQASTDRLTGLMNRRSSRTERRLRASGVDFAFVMADLDHFKSLNDPSATRPATGRCGCSPRRCATPCASDDLTCRFGGEEFVVLLPGIETHEAVEIMERVRGHWRARPGAATCRRSP